MKIASVGNFPLIVPGDGLRDLLGIPNSKIEIHSISSSQNDYNPTNWATSGVHLIENTMGVINITGFLALPDQSSRILVNSGSLSWRIQSNDANSLAENRILTSGNMDFLVITNQVITIKYSSVDARWRIISNTG